MKLHYGRAPLRKTASHFSGSRSVRRLAVAGLCAPIHFYRRFLSRLMPPACRFQPSCSAYALEAIQSHGPVKGLYLAIRRLARCHPVKFLGGGSGFDPVPHSRHGAS